MHQLFEYNTFIDRDHNNQATPPDGYMKIQVCLVFDIKHDGLHKARLVVDEHLTDVTVDSAYSGIVSLLGLLLLVFLGKLNVLEM